MVCSKNNNYNGMGCFLVPDDVKINLLNSQLAPIFDRVGRIMIDLAPHLALQGSGIQTM